MSATDPRQRRPTVSQYVPGDASYDDSQGYGWVLFARPRRLRRADR